MIIVEKNHWFLIAILTPGEGCDYRKAKRASQENRILECHSWIDSSWICIVLWCLALCFLPSDENHRGKKVTIQNVRIFLLHFCSKMVMAVFPQNRSISGERPHLRRGNLGEPCRWNKFDHFFLKSNYQRPCLGDVQFIASPGLEINDSNRANDLHISSWPTWWMPKVDSESRGIKAGVVSLIMPNSKLVNDCSFYQMTWFLFDVLFFPAILSFLPV